MSELERSLYLLGAELAVPQAPDLVTAVSGSLEPRRERTPVRRRWVVAIVACALALLGATLAIPDARSAFLRVLHIGGERIEIVDELPDVAAQPDLDVVLGQPTALEEARRTAEFELRELDEEPDRVYVDFRRAVWFLYGTPTNVHLLVSQTPRHSVDGPALVKKLSGAGTTVEEVTVNGRPGVFLSGEPHYMFLIDESGNAVEDSARLAANVLVWDDDGVAYRLEGDFELDEALQLAESLR